MAGSATTLILRMLLWPLVLAVGFAAVVWFYELTDSTRTWREIDEVMSLSLVAWFAGPALAWFLIPPGWDRPRWAIWTLASGGVATLAAFLVLVGLLAYETDVLRVADFSLTDIERIIGSFGDKSVEKSVWHPAGVGLYVLGMSVGYVFGLGMMSRVLGLMYFFGCALGSVAVYLGYRAIAQAAGSLIVSMQWEAALASSLPMAFAAAAVASAFGAVAVVVWALVVRPRSAEAAAGDFRQW